MKKIIFPLNKLTKEQKKIIYLSIFTFGLLILAWAVVYRPLGRQYALARKELGLIESQIEEINRLTSGKELNQAVKEMKVELSGLKNYFPDTDEKVIYNLLEAAKKLKIQVKSISPFAKKPLEDNASGFQMEEFPVSLRLACEYRSLCEYLYSLRNNFPFLVSINEVNIQGRGEGEPQLDASLKISVYSARER
ncbi:MAG: GspMb/PilO family protein [Candidatus Omnitrophota bacterium]